MEDQKTYTCKACGKIFAPKRKNKYEPPTYCSRECARKTIGATFNWVKRTDTGSGTGKS